jgi:hypothetical protein
MIGDCCNAAMPAFGTVRVGPFLTALVKVGMSAAYIAAASSGKLSAPTMAGKAADAAGY